MLAEPEKSQVPRNFLRWLAIQPHAAYRVLLDGMNNMISPLENSMLDSMKKEENKIKENVPFQTPRRQSFIIRFNNGFGV